MRSGRQKSAYYKHYRKRILDDGYGETYPDTDIIVVLPVERVAVTVGERVEESVGIRGCGVLSFTVPVIT